MNAWHLFVPLWLHVDNLIHFFGILQNLLKVVYTFITKKYQQCSVDLIFTLYKTQKVLTDNATTANTIHLAEFREFRGHNTYLIKIFVGIKYGVPGIPEVRCPRNTEYIALIDIGLIMGYYKFIYRL